MLAICDLFQWDVGHLLGEYTEKTQENSFICEKTGLSEKALDNLQILKEHNSRDWCLDVLSALIEDKDFLPLSVSISKYTAETAHSVDDEAPYIFREIDSKDIWALKVQRLLFEILDRVSDDMRGRPDYRMLYRLLFSWEADGRMTNEELQKHLAKLDSGDISDFE